MTRPALELAGSLLMTGIPGLDLDRDTRAALRRMAPSGIILFARNFRDAEQLARLNAALHALPSRPRIAIDQEGGRVARLGDPFTSFPPARDVGMGMDLAQAEDVGRALALEMASAGVDIDFAPVLDVDSNPANPIIGDRAFSSRAEEVAACATAFLRGLHSGGILGCGKHFPGHGDTELDSHIDLPTVRRSRRDLESVELLPFRAAIRAGVPMLMTAHVLYPALDESNPATFSASILRDLLRREMGFAGVLISDDLEMGAVSRHMQVQDAAVSALRAGIDWALICNDLDLAVRAAERIAAAIEDGRLDRNVLEASARRIRSLRLPPRHGAAPDPPVAAHRQLAERIRRHATASRAV
jgi:beta-N-acetylhexosaminidase